MSVVDERAAAWRAANAEAQAKRDRERARYEAEGRQLAAERDARVATARDAYDVALADAEAKRIAADQAQRAVDVFKREHQVRSGRMAAGVEAAIAQAAPSTAMREAVWRSPRELVLDPPRLHGPGAGTMDALAMAWVSAWAMSQPGFLEALREAIAAGPPRPGLGLSDLSDEAFETRLAELRAALAAALGAAEEANRVGEAALRELHRAER